MKHEVPRMGDVPLAFDGDLLSERSSRRDGVSRWTEVRVYSTVTGLWVTELVGRSTLPGQVDRRTVTVCRTPTEVRAGLMRPGNGAPYLTDLAFDALEDAIDKDPRLDAAAEERI